MSVKFISKYFLLFIVFAFMFSSCQDEQITNQVSKSELVKDQSREIVQDWHELYLEIEKDLPLFRPAATSRALGYINLAAYEAGVPGMPDFRSYSKLNAEYVGPTVDQNSEYYWPAAINAAYSATFQHFLHNATNEHVNKILSLENKFNEQFRSTKGQDVVQRSIIWGKDVATSVISYAKTDVEAETQIKDARPASHIPPVGIGLWVSGDATPQGLFPYWGKTRAFFTPESAQLGLPPIPYNEAPSSPYYKEGLEVYERVKARTPEDMWMAEFWSDDIVGLTFSPPARVFAMANQLIDNYNLDLETTLHLYLKLGLAANDAAVSCWNAKYLYNIERPFSYIQNLIDPSFKPILGRAINNEGITPPFPAYPSGHSTFAAISAGVFIDFFGNSTDFTDRCHEGRTEFIGVPRNFKLFTELAEENAYSRIPLGVHWRMDCKEGLRMGYDIADYVNKANFKRR